MPFRPTESIAVIAILTTACATAPPPRGVPVSSPLAERFCAAIHTITVERRNACCGSQASDLAGLCVEQLSQALFKGTVTLDAAAVERCAADTELELEGCAWVTPLVPKPAATCSGLLRGTLAEGAACGSSLECADGLYCGGLSSEGPGQCRPAAPARARCEVPADNLAAFTASRDDPRHLACAGNCVLGRCLPFAEAGETCAGRSTCRPGLNCLAGSCTERPLPVAGEACTAGDTCADGTCRDDVCVALKERGAPCRLPFECRGLVCEKAGDATEGVCGDPCGSSAALPPG